MCGRCSPASRTPPAWRRAPRRWCAGGCGSIPTPALASSFSRRTCTRLLSIYPELEVELAIRERPGDLVADGFDLAIRFGEPQLSSLIGRKILETRVLTCAAPSYLERFGTPTHPRDLANHECIQYREPLTHRHYAWVLEGPEGEIEVPTRGRLTVTDAGALLAACLAGHGIAQPLELHARPHLDAGRLVQLLPDWAEERFPLLLYLPTRRLPVRQSACFSRLRPLSGGLAVRGGLTVWQDEPSISSLPSTATSDEAEGRRLGGSLHRPTALLDRASVRGLASPLPWMGYEGSVIQLRCGVPPQVAFAGIVTDWPLRSSRLRSYGVERKPAPATQRPASASPLRKLPPATPVTI